VRKEKKRFMPHEKYLEERIPKKKSHLAGAMGGGGWQGGLSRGIAIVGRKGRDSEMVWSNFLITEP